MEIASPTATEWGTFLTWARQEGWRVPPREISLYRGALSDGAFVLRDEDEPCGFVTAVGYERSGWIGNLLVPPQCRGRGFGAFLFDHAVDVLRRRGIETLWLTASSQGRPLYERRGFRAVDGTVRWVFEGAEAGGGEEARGSRAELLEGDAYAWGESRLPLLTGLASEGKILAFGGTVALLQSGPGMQVLGPWVSREICPRENRQLLTAVLAAAEAGGELVADVLASSPVQPLLRAAGFEPRGGCDLMVCGPLEETRLTSLVSLASLGSMG